jgi:hypothetical protein
MEVLRESGSCGAEPAFPTAGTLDTVAMDLSNPASQRSQATFRR